jgi:hypothetical protein
MVDSHSRSWNVLGSLAVKGRVAKTGYDRGVRG